MDQKTVASLEGKIEEAIAEIIVKMGLKKLPLLPARHAMHLMAKSVVTRDISASVLAAGNPCRVIREITA